MQSIQIIGLFVGADKSSKIKTSIDLAKLNSDTLVSQEINENMRAVAVLVKDSFEGEIVQNIFNFYRPIKIMTLENPIDIANVRQYIAAKSKTEIMESPVIRKRQPHKGISSELTF